MAAIEGRHGRPENATAYARAFEALIDREVEKGRIGRVSAPGRECLFRPGQVVTSSGDADRVARQLPEILDLSPQRVQVDEPTPGLSRFTYDDAASLPVPKVVEALRRPDLWGDDPAPWVQPHHLTVGYGRIMGNPEAPPQVPTTSPTPPDPARALAGLGVTVGVCDTGMWKASATEHHAWFAGRYRFEADDVDGLVDSGGALAPDPPLALQAGHGTFVAGVVRESAPGVRVDPEVALEPTGLGDEIMLAAALANLEPTVEVVNLSLGCVTLDNRPSLPMWLALQRLCRDVVVVAAAGNAGDSRPRWPAAFTQVVGVAAVEVDESGVRPARDSSHGSWVDACAPGTWTTTFVRGRLPDDLGGATFGDPYATWSGTSFAAPVVAGRIAEVMTHDGVRAREAARRLLDRPRWHPDYGTLVL